MASFFYTILLKKKPEVWGIQTPV